MQNAPPVLVIGAGISGLACAHFLRERGVPVHVLEASDRPGGLIRSVEQDGFRFELGPQSFLSSEPLQELIAKLNLDDQLLRADSRAPRYILHGGELIQAPMGPLSLIRTPLLGAGAKWRLATEIFRRAHPPDDDESVAVFVRRKFGDDLLQHLVGPMISGIYAGDPERLSLRAAFPEIHRFEREQGSVLRGAIKSMRKRNPAPRAERSKARAGLCSFRDGVETLPRALAHSLGNALSYNASAQSLHRSQSNSHAAFKIQVAAGGPPETISALAVVLAAPCDVTARLAGDMDARFAEPFAEIEYAPVAVVSAGYAQSAIGRSTHGFGFLVPRSEGLRMLGTVWNSSLFPGRAPEGRVAMATFAGGATDPEICTWPEEKIAEHVCGEVARVMQISAPPVTLRVQCYARALPQYNLGHGKILDRLARLAADQPGLFLAGNYFGGPSIGACTKQAQATAAAVCDYLASIGQLTSTVPPSAPK